MGMKLGLALLMLLGGAAAVAADAVSDPEEVAREQRWIELKRSIFPGRVVHDGTDWLGITAPDRALDAALVPVALMVRGDHSIRGIYLIIDENPGPLAGHFVFGPAGDAHSLKLRVRVNAYTYVHMVAESADGELYAAARFVKAAGGCSAPAGAAADLAAQDLGHIKLRFEQPFAAGKPMEAKLMIRHPNFNGMQMDQVTHLYTPAMFIRTIDVSYNGAEVLHMDSDISLSADPVIDFGLVPPDRGQLKVMVRDTHDETFGQSFDLQ